MGPRPFGRGNSGTPDGPRLSGRLQWGHDLSVVEIGLAAPAALHLHRLQWGHDLSVVEMGMSRA